MLKVLLRGGLAADDGNQVDEEEEEGGVAGALAFATPDTLAFIRVEDTVDCRSDSWLEMTDDGGEKRLLRTEETPEACDIDDILACLTLGGGVFTNALSDAAADIDVWES